MSTTYPSSKQTFTTHVDNSSSDLIDAGDVNPIQDTVAALEDALGYGTTNGVLPAGLTFPNTYGVTFKKAAGTADASIVENASDNMVFNVASGKKFSFTVAGTEKAYLDANGIGKAFIGARVYSAGDQLNIADNTWTTVVLDTENYDVGSNFASNTFTAPVAGYYSATAAIRWVNNTLDSSDVYGIRLYKNGTTAQAASNLGTGIQSALSATIADTFHLAANDTIVLQAYHTHGDATPDIDGGLPEYTFMEIHLVSQD